MKEEAEERKIMKDLGQSTNKEMEEHRIDHWPYRSWCPVCIQSKGKERDHPRRKRDVGVLPEFSWDYCFPGDELGFKWTVLVGRERGSKSIMGSALPEKGGRGLFGIEKCLEFLEENRDREATVIVKN